MILFIYSFIIIEKYTYISMIRYIKSYIISPFNIV